MEVYLLSVEELNKDSEAERLRELAMKNMDAVRLEKVKRLKPGETGNLAIGAGLLLQLAVRRTHVIYHGMYPQIYHGMHPQTYHGIHPRMYPVCFHVSQILDLLGGEKPVQVEYCYGEHGKPDFAGGMSHFNLSHSGQYVCCALAEEEVGIDIQRMHSLKNMRIAERFFSQEENELLRACRSEKERQELFFRIWVRKEAYAKLTGAGIAATVEQNVMTEHLASVEWQEFDQPEGYRMAVCRYGSSGGMKVICPE